MSKRLGQGCKPRPAGEISRYFCAFIGFDTRAILVTGALNLAVALLEGVGLMLLLPLLTVAGALGNRDVHRLDWLDTLTQGALRLGKEDLLLPMLGLFVTLIAAQSLLTLARDRRAQVLQHGFVDHLRGVLFRAIADARWSFLAQQHSSEWLSVLTTDVQRVGVGTFFLLQLFTLAMMFLVYLVVAVHLSPPVTGLALLTGGLLWGVLRRSDKRVKQSGRSISAANQGMFAEIQEFLAALKLIKIHGEELACIASFTGAVEALRKQQIEFLAVKTHIQMSHRIGSAIALAGFTYLALEVYRLPTANLLVLIAVFSRMLPKLSQAHGAMQQLWHMLPAFTHLQHWVEDCERHRDRPTLAPDTSWRLQDGLTLNELSYRHPQGHQTLRVSKLFIPACRTTAIIGPTGGGKTTLLDLISGLMVPDTGMVLADGVPLETCSGWRRYIAYVPQETTIMDGTVRDNLTWGNVHESQSRIDEALRQAAADNFVRRLPQGLETRVGERGVRLSGGERQRLALARALLRQPRILILDETMSALDQENKQMILESIRALHKQMTILIVTHRHEELVNLVDGYVTVNEGVVSDWIPTVSLWT